MGELITMQSYETEFELPFAIDKVFAFHCDPQNILELIPEEANAVLLESPSLLSLGSEVELKFSAFGFSKKVRIQIMEFTENQLIADEQLSGPFKAFNQKQLFTAVEEEVTRISYAVEYKPPGGLIGMALKPPMLLNYIKQGTLYRRKKTRELLEAMG